MKRLLIDLEKCTHCGQCANRCPFGALRIVQGKLMYAPGKCMEDCEVCRLVCPASALDYEGFFCGGCQRGGKCGGCNGCGGCGK